MQPTQRWKLVIRSVIPITGPPPFVSIRTTIMLMALIRPFFPIPRTSMGVLFRICFVRGFFPVSMASFLTVFSPIFWDPFIMVILPFHWYLSMGVPWPTHTALFTVMIFPLLGAPFAKAIFFAPRTPPVAVFFSLQRATPARAFFPVYGAPISSRGRWDLNSIWEMRGLAICLIRFSKRH